MHFFQAGGDLFSFLLTQVRDWNCRLQDEKNYVMKLCVLLNQSTFLFEANAHFILRLVICMTL